MALIIPFAHPPSHPDVKAWTFIFAVVALAIMPAILPFFLTRRYGTQNKLRAILYCCVAVIFFMELV